MGLLVVVLGILGVLEPCLAQLQPLQSQPEGTSRVPELPPQYSQHDDDPPPPFCISTLLPTTTKEARAGSQSPNRTLILGLAAVALVTLSAATLSSTLRKDNCQAHTTHQLGEQAGFSRSDTSFPEPSLDLAWLHLRRHYHAVADEHGQLDVHQRDTSGRTPLHVAVSQHDLARFAGALLTHNADFNAQDREGNTPLLSAVRAGCVSGVKTLLAHNVNPDASDKKGQTPLMQACLQDYRLVVKILLDAGADPTRMDFTGRSALHWAVAVGSLDCVHVLEEHAGATLPWIRSGGVPSVIDICVHEGHAAMLARLLAHAKTHGRGKAALAEAVQALALQKSIRTPEELASLQAQVTAAQQRLKNSAVDKQSSSRRLRSHSAASPSMPLATLPNHTRDKASSPSIERTQQPRGRGGSYLSKRRRSGGVGGPARPSASPRATAPQSGNDTTKAQGGDEHLPSHTREWRRRYMRAYRRRLGSSHEQLFTTVRTAELQQTTYRAVLAALRRDLAILQQVQSNAEHQ